MRGSVAVPLVALLFVVLQAVGHAADVTVANTNDLGPGSLRQAIMDVPDAGTIDFSSALSGQTITLASELMVGKGMTVDASGLVGGLTVAGGNATRLVAVSASGNLTLRRLTLTGGNGMGAANSGFGGAIYNAGITAVERCTVNGNFANNYGGGIHNALASTLTITESTLAGNSTSLYGGAVSNSSSLTVSRSTFSANTSGYEGGGIYTDFYGGLAISNSTFSGNTAEYYGGAIFNGSPLTLNSATLSGNSASRIGGGVYNDFFGTLSFNNSIIAGNAAPESAEIFGNSSGSNNLTGGDPKLSPIGNWGGSTQTMPPLPDSPAIDAGGSTTLLIDQRGLARILGGGLDIGAFETALSDFNPDGVTIYARVPAGDSTGVFEISADPNFLPVVSTLAGTGTPGYVDDTRLSSKLGYPSGVAQDTLGAVFFADTGNHRIRMVGTDGMVSTIAGSGDYGLANGDGPSAEFAFPSALAVGPDNNLYVADTYNHRICKLTRPAVPGGSWTVTTLAGSENRVADFVNESGTAARFNYPYGLALDPAGNVYVADAANHAVRKVTAAGKVSTYAGSGTAGLSNTTDPLDAHFNTPESVAIFGGNLYVADALNHQIRKIAAPGTLPGAIAGIPAGAVSSFAGSSSGFADGLGALAKFNTPSGLASDGQGSLYVSDEQNHRVRRITATGDVTTVAGAGVAALVNGNSTVARFDSPTGVLVGLDGNLVVADAQNHALRRIVIKPLTIDSEPFADASGTQVRAVLDVVALGLDPSVTYYFRWKSTTTGITQPLGESFFLYDFPVVATKAASNVSPTSARLNAAVDPKSSRTKVDLEYSTDPALLHPYEVTTLAGSGVAGFATGTGSDAQFSDPTGVVANATTGDVYVADRLNHRIRKITSTGVVTTFAGSGVAGFSNANGEFAQFEKPAGIAIDQSGNLYVADEFNHRIRKINADGDVTTFAGSGVAGFVEGESASAQFLYPTGVAVDADGNVYVADSGNQRIRKITAATGLVTTLAGSGTAGFNDGIFSEAQFTLPQALAVDATGRVLVADTGNQRIRVIDAAGVYTLAGTGVGGFLDGSGSAALFASPRGIAVDGAGIAYVADGGNHRIRRISIDGDVSTLAGSGIAGHQNSPLIGLYPATASQLNLPVGIGIDAADGLFVTQEGLLRKIARSATMPTVTVAPDATGSGERPVFAAVDQPLLPGATYYFRATGSNYRGSAEGEILSFVTPQSAILVFAGSDTSAPAIINEQAGSIDFGSTPNGTPAIRYFTIANPGGWPLTVSSVNGPAGYQLTGGAGVINSLASLTFGVTLPATSRGTFSGEITITSDAPGEEVFTFTITGEVLDPPVLTTLASSAIGSGTATFNATVNPLGSSTTVWFEWSQDLEFDGVAVTTVAGSTAGYAEGSATMAMFNQPSGVTTDAGGNIYVADTMNHRIRKITPDGTTSTFAGSGVAGFADGPATTAQFNQPVGLAMSVSGVLFVSDSQNHRIRAVNSAGAVVTYAGLGTPGFTDGIPAAARFQTPSGLAIAANGTLYVADSGNHRIRKVALDGSVSTLAGTGAAGSANGASASAEFNAPAGIATDSVGLVYVTEATSHAVRQILPDGTTSIFVGSSTTAGMANASGAAARFSNPAGLAVGIGGVLYVADKGNHRIRKVDQGGTVTTLAGTGSPGTFDGVGEVARFFSPFSLVTTETGAVIVGELGSSILREITSLQVLRQAVTGLTGTADIPVQLSVTGLPVGSTYYSRAIATNGGGTTVGNIQSSSQGAFQDWQVAKFGVDAGNPLIAGASASPAGDGVSNLLKYAFGLSPLVPVTGNLTVMGLDGGSLTLTYTKVLAATDLLYSAEWSADLATWTSAGITEQVLSGDGVTQQILASVPSAPASAKFLRIHITLQ